MQNNRGGCAWRSAVACRLGNMSRDRRAVKLRCGASWVLLGRREASDRGRARCRVLGSSCCEEETDGRVAPTLFVAACPWGCMQVDVQRARGGIARWKNDVSQAGSPAIQDLGGALVLNTAASSALHSPYTLQNLRCEAVRAARACVPASEEPISRLSERNCL